MKKNNWLFIIICFAIIFCVACSDNFLYKKAYKTAYKNNHPSSNRAKIYHSNFDLFSLAGLDTNTKNIDRNAYIYQNFWADSFHLYYYHQDIKRACFYQNLPDIKDFNYEQPVWKFYKLTDTSYISYFYLNSSKSDMNRQNYLHNQLWGYHTKNKMYLICCEYKQQNLKNKYVLIFEKDKIREEKNSLFWQLVTHKFENYTTTNDDITFLDSLIRSFQK